MEILDEKNLLSVAEKAAQSTGTLLRTYNATVLKNLGRDIKIDADRESHSVVINVLEKTGIPVLSEEDDLHDFSGSLKWIVDPLDGSINFLRGIPVCAVSI